MTHDVKWRHFLGEIVPWAVWWCRRYGVSYRDLEEVLEERGIPVDHTTICRWVQAYAPVIERRLLRHRHPGGFSRSRRVDETCIEVIGGAFHYRNASWHRGPPKAQHNRPKNGVSSSCRRSIRRTSSRASHAMFPS